MSTEKRLIIESRTTINKLIESLNKATFLSSKAKKKAELAISEAKIFLEKIEE